MGYYTIWLVIVKRIVVPGSENPRSSRKVRRRPRPERRGTLQVNLVNTISVYQALGCYARTLCVPASTLDCVIFLGLLSAVVQRCGGAETRGLRLEAEKHIPRRTL